MTKISKTLGLYKLPNAMRYSLNGLSTAFGMEVAFRQEVFLATLLIPVALTMNVSRIEKVCLIFSVLFVLVVELLNTAVEHTVNRIENAYHPLSKKIKDIGSAAVLISILAMFATWLLILC